MALNGEQILDIVTKTRQSFILEESVVRNDGSYDLYEDRKWVGQGLREEMEAIIDSAIKDALNIALQKSNDPKDYYIKLIPQMMSCEIRYYLSNDPVAATSSMSFMVDGSGDPLVPRRIKELIKDKPAAIITTVTFSDMYKVVS